MSQGTDRDMFDRSLGNALVTGGKLNARALDQALRLREENHEGLLNLLPKLALVSERDLAEAAALELRLPLVQRRDYPSQPVLADRLAPRFLKEFRLVPLSADDGGLVLAMADPLDRFAIEAVQMATGRKVSPRVAVPAELEAAIERLYGRAAAPAEAAAKTVDNGVELDVEQLKDLASEAPVVQQVNQMIAAALDARASDIHIEPFEGRLKLRYRIDGVLCEVDAPPNAMRAAIVSRIKIMANLDIAERRRPQDGRIKLAIRGIPVDFRVATLPTMHGEAVVMRVLNRESVRLDLVALGIGEEDRLSYLRQLEQPHGILLVTGPTGSGKTTTLYASMVHLNTPGRKILSVEDPIEYQLEGINQVQVKPAIGLGFASTLRSMLRHDPDVIMVGEIRDGETAEIAVQAALTGHLVLSTLHTNGAAASIARLLDMGVQDYLLTSTVNGIAAQRLVRTLCSHCRESYDAMPELIEQLGLRRFQPTGEILLWRARGCEECGGTGFLGRTCIFEFLVVDDEIRRLVLRRAEVTDLQRAAVERGMRTMHEDGMLKALAGITTVEEVLKVTREF